MTESLSRDPGFPICTACRDPIHSGWLYVRHPNGSTQHVACPDVAPDTQHGRLIEARRRLLAEPTDSLPIAA